MKRRICLILSLLVLVLSFTGCYPIRLPRSSEVVLRYGHKPYGEEEALHSFTLTDAEVQAVRKHLRAAKYLSVGAGCAFKNGSEYVYMYSLIVDDRVVAIANDDHHILWDVERDRYYEMKDEGWEYLTDLFGQYLGVAEFPYWGDLTE